MTQVQTDTHLSVSSHFRAQMQDSNGGQISTALSSTRNPHAREVAPSLGNILRNNSLPDQMQLHETAMSYPTRRTPPDVSHRNGSRRTAAFPLQPIARRDSEFALPRTGQGTRFNEPSGEGQAALNRPWNPSSLRDNQLTLEPSRRDPLNGLSYSDAPSPTEDMRQSLRRGSAAVWNPPVPSSASAGSQVLATQRPSLSSQSTEASSRVSPQGLLRQSNGRNGSGIFQSSAGVQDALPVLSPTSSDGTHPTARRGQFSAADVENAFRNFSISNGVNHQRLPASSQHEPHARQFDHACMARTDSSPGHSSMGWDGALASQWASGANARSNLNGGTPSGHRDRPFESSAYPHGHPSSENMQVAPTHSLNSRLPRYGSGGEDSSMVRMGLNLNDMGGQFDYRNGVQDFNGFHTNNVGSAQGAYRGLNGFSHARNSPNPGRDFITHHQTFNLPPELTSSAINYFGPRYGQHQWTQNQYAIPPTPSIPLLAEQDPSKVWRSALMDEFRMASRAGRRWEVKDVYDHVVEFAGDQHGSRFLQDKLKTANSEEKDRVFQEILPNAMQLMKDVFGNYVLQKFFEHGDQTQKAALVNKMRGHVFALSTQTYACRVVQKALGHILVEQQIDLMQELDGKVMDCIKCENGNHVIQVAIEQVPLEHIPFMIGAIQHDVPFLSMHKYGCRVIQRMLEHAREEVLTWLVPELHKCCGMLIADQFGNYVPAHIVEKGSPDDRNKVIEVVRRNLLQYSKQKFASHVVEKCIRFGTDQHRREFMQQLSSCNSRGENELEHLIRDGFANYVIQSLLETLQFEDYAYFCRILQPALDRARLPNPNKQAENVARKMHRLERGPMFLQQHYVSGPTWNNSVFA